MALSDRERRLLAEMEAALASDDPRLQSTLTGGDTATLLRKAPGGALAGLALIVAGIGILFAGLISQIVPLGIAGFLVSLVGLVLFVSNLSFGKSSFKTPKSARPKWSSRLEDRWERRNFEN